jgi:hypothetical protein
MYFTIEAKKLGGEFLGRLRSNIDFSCLACLNTVFGHLVDGSRDTEIKPTVFHGEIQFFTQLLLCHIYFYYRDISLTPYANLSPTVCVQRMCPKTSISGTPRHPVCLEAVIV